VDTVDNEYEQTFSAWPIRFYIVHGGQVLFKACPDELNTYDSIPPRLDRFFKEWPEQGTVAT
jgi:hypothetical protein